MSVFRHTDRPLRCRLFLAALSLVALSIFGTARGAVSIYVPPETLAEHSPWIVEAMVESTRSGFDPQAGTLATYTTLRVEAMHRGPASHATLVIREAGGSYGGLVHETDAVPVYRPGERVFVFLEPAHDGALRTAGMFFGKFVIETDLDGRIRWARRELDGQGTIHHRPPPQAEHLPLRDLVALATTLSPTTIDDERHLGVRQRLTAVATRGGPGPPRLMPYPPEFDRLLWGDEEPRGQAPDGAGQAAASATLDPSAGSGEPRVSSNFRPLSLLSPSRWPGTDSGEEIIVNIERARDPLGDGVAAVSEVLRAMVAWNEVPEARVTLVPGDTNIDYTGTHQQSPTSDHTGTNIVLFDDPYHDISNPTGCSGVLAIGGYWRTEEKTSLVNGVAFHGAVQLYVIFSNDFECVLGIPDDLAEVAAHELGHGIGIGHSLADDAIMRSSPYRSRGPRLGDDDHDAAHCHYPHTLQLDAPNGGEILEAGRVHEIKWSASGESGPDSGSVSLEYTTDGGSTWTTIVDDEPNDGTFDWAVPSAASGSGVVRVVRHSRTGLTSSPFPQECSQDASDAPFEIVPWSAKAGAVPSASDAEGGLTVAKAYVEGWVVLNWGASCSPDATDYAVYEGDLKSLRGGVWDHAPAVCSTSSDLEETVFTQPGDRYFLVVPVAGSFEGHLGRGSNGQFRPVADLACAEREADPVCE